MGLSYRRRYDSSVTSTVSTGITVRKLQLAEIEELAAVIPEVTDAQLANRWREQTLGYRELLVAERDGELMGTVSIAELQRPSSIHLFALEVAGEHRNEGIGGDIVRWVMDEARRRGRERVFLEVRTDNPARRLYHRLGFRRVGPAFVNSWWLFNADGSQTRMESRRCGWCGGCREGEPLPLTPSPFTERGNRRSADAAGRIRAAVHVTEPEASVYFVNSRP